MRPRRRSGCPAQEVSLLWELPLTSTFVTNYLIHPFVGLIPAGLAWQLSADEVERCWSCRAGTQGEQDAHAPDAPWNHL